MFQSIAAWKKSIKLAEKELRWISYLRKIYQKILKILALFPCEHFPKVVEKNWNYVLYFFKINVDNTKL